ncbi:MAG TPA: glutamate synthase subunit beta [Mycobacteriales bacterium]|nr:glutamate synthase subunit beta [Mycobacteriales bacterium]
MVANPWGFLRHARQEAPKRPVAERLLDWEPVYGRPSSADVRTQASRCMDCGVAFCHAGCPLGNLIPEWNELTAGDDWHAAIERLHATNNFPEFTGWLCPAPCEASCVLAINAEPVAIKQVELAIIDRAFDEGWVTPRTAPTRTGRRVAVVGSGPAGLAAAQQLTRAGHDVVVYERDDRLGGLLRYGIPDFKMPKGLIDRRLAQLTAEGTELRAGVGIGGPGGLDPAELRAGVDAVILACGALHPRDLDLPGRELDGVHQAMDYLPQANRARLGSASPSIDAAGKHVVIIGGGDTAADCLGTANRQGAASVTQLDHNPRPPEERDILTNPWPEWPKVHKSSLAHEEGVVEAWAREATAVVGGEDGRIRSIRVHEVEIVRTDRGRAFQPVPGSEQELPCDLLLLAAGFVGTEPGELLDGLGVQVDPNRGTVRIDARWQTSADGVYACGDAGRGASLVVWAIAEGRSCAAAVDAALSGHSDLPAPVAPGARPM